MKPPSERVRRRVSKREAVAKARKRRYSDKQEDKRKMAREELLSTRSDKENKPTDTQRLENLKQSDNNTAEQDGPIEATKEELKPIKNCDQRQMTGSEGHLTIQNQTDEEKNQLETTKGKKLVWSYITWVNNLKPQGIFADPAQQLKNEEMTSASISRFNAFHNSQSQQSYENVLDNEVCCPFTLLAYYTARGAFLKRAHPAKSQREILVAMRSALRIAAAVYENEIVENHQFIEGDVLQLYFAGELQALRPTKGWMTYWVPNNNYHKPMFKQTQRTDNEDEIALGLVDPVVETEPEVREQGQQGGNYELEELILDLDDHATKYILIPQLPKPRKNANEQTCVPPKAVKPCAPETLIESCTTKASPEPARTPVGYTSAPFGLHKTPMKAAGVTPASKQLTYTQSKLNFTVKTSKRLPQRTPKRLQSKNSQIATPYSLTSMQTPGLKPSFSLEKAGIASVGTSVTGPSGTGPSGTGSPGADTPIVGPPEPGLGLLSENTSRLPTIVLTPGVSTCETTTDLPQERSSLNQTPHSKLFAQQAQLNSWGNPPSDRAPQAIH